MPLLTWQSLTPQNVRQLQQIDLLPNRIPYNPECQHIPEPETILPRDSNLQPQILTHTDNIPSNLTQVRMQMLVRFILQIKTSRPNHSPETPVTSRPVTVLLQNLTGKIISLFRCKNFVKLTKEFRVIQRMVIKVLLHECRNLAKHEINCYRLQINVKVNIRIESSGSRSDYVVIPH